MSAGQNAAGASDNTTDAEPTLSGNQPPVEIEIRRDKVANDLLQQKFNLIRWVTAVIGTVIVALYGMFIWNMIHLFRTGEAYTELPVTTVVLIGMTGSIPTILSISMLVGIFSKESSKDEKAAGLDITTVAKIGGEILKYVKQH